jgi:hypothetical protein
VERCLMMIVSLQSGDRPMIRKGPGDYHDRFCNIGFRVFRDRVPTSLRIEQGWRFTVDGGKWSAMYDRKELAAQAARCAIYDILEAKEKAQ